MSDRAALAKQVLQTLASGEPVLERDALQLRNWAVTPTDAMLTLREVAKRILDDEENRKSHSV